MPHNISLPTHQYVGIVPPFVLHGGASEAQGLLPAVWIGVSVTPGRSLGCHVLLENGALVVDLPLHALRASAKPSYQYVELSDVVAWDCYGWDAECWQPSYLHGLDCAILSADHREAVDRGSLWFAIDHLSDGFALEPGQHKHLWVVERHRDDALMLLPQDRLLIEEKSFTAIDGIPPVRRQSTVWSAE